MESLLSIVLPVHNEAFTIEKVLQAYCKSIATRIPSEIIVAEDGSTDGTKEILTSLKNELPMVLLSDQNRKGYALGVSAALRSCKSDWVFFSDSDGQYFPSDFWNLWKKRDSYDMIVGCKTVRRESIHRIVLAKGFHKIVNGLFGLNLNDADCGFRLIRKEVIQSLLDDVRFLEYSFWAEFTIRACLKGFRVCEVPIHHSSRVNGDTHIYKPSNIPMIILKQLGGLAHLYPDIKNSR